MDEEKFEFPKINEYWWIRANLTEPEHPAYMEKGKFYLIKTVGLNNVQSPTHVKFECGRYTHTNHVSFVQKVKEPTDGS